MKHSYKTMSDFYMTLYLLELLGVVDDAALGDWWDAMVDKEEV